MTGRTRISASVADAARRTVRPLLDPASAPVVIAVILLLAAALVFVAAGGLRPASRSAATVESGTAVTTSLYEVTVHEATVTDEVEQQYWEAEDGETLLLVSMRLTNLTDRPAAVQGSADRVTSRLLDSDAALLTLDGITPTEGARAWHSDGGQRSPVLQPGVPTEVVVGWPVPEDAITDGKVRLDVHDARAQGGQIIVSASAITWRRTELVARVGVEVTP